MKNNIPSLTGLINKILPNIDNTGDPHPKILTDVVEWTIQTKFNHINLDSQ